MYKTQDGLDDSKVSLNQIKKTSPKIKRAKKKLSTVSKSITKSGNYNVDTSYTQLHSHYQ